MNNSVENNNPAYRLDLCPCCGVETGNENSMRGGACSVCVCRFVVCVCVCSGMHVFCGASGGVCGCIYSGAWILEHCSKA